ncbi:hypothetical protein CLF_104233 [Clonorchis sinensis]|uniref:SUZ domain-containing protein n=1 Tax=Clonorchis sinensis TaxID=79923 RepID=G7YB74_CLOSI|nr:hypothetical protein CLF_104233 [Clonorchis sinensis]
MDLIWPRCAERVRVVEELTNVPLREDRVGVCTVGTYFRPPTTVKTLEQREADYAAARRRILGSDGSDADVDDASTTKGNTKTSGSGNGHGGNSLPRQSPASNMNATTATPLMSIQATPALASDFGTSSVTSSLTSNGAVQPRVTHNGSARQGLAVVNVAQKLQQQPQPTPNLAVIRPVIQTQQPRLLTTSASSPSFFNPRTTNQPVPLFPSHTNAANTGLLPTPPGFNYSMQNATLNGGGGIHHSQSAAYALVQQFGLFQQQYQQALNGFQNHLISPTMSQTGASLNPFTFSPVASQPTANQK